MDKIALISHLTKQIKKELDEIKNIYNGLSNSDKHELLNSYLLKNIIFIDDVNREEIEKECILEEIKLKYSNNIDSMTLLCKSIVQKDKLTIQ